MDEEYDIVEIEGQHGEIHLHIPKREPTQEEEDAIYRAVAKIALSIDKRNSLDQTSKNC